MPPTKKRKPATPGEVKFVENKEKAHRDEMLDEALDESFPASDPPSITEPGSDIFPPVASKHSRTRKS
jgi:hypothetical protein